MRRRTGSLLAIGVFSLGSLCGFLRAQEVFDPERHFPSPALAYVAVDSIDGLREGLASTLLGRILTHPMTRRACAGFERGVREAFTQGVEGPNGRGQAFIDALGIGPIEFFGLFTGRIAVSFRGLGPQGPEVGVAIGHGRKAAGLARVYGHLVKQYEENAGALSRGEMQGVPYDGWPTPLGLVYKLDLGSHSLFILGEDMARATVALYRGGADEDGAAKPAPLAESPLLKSLSRTIAVPGRQCVLALELRTLRQLALGAAGENAAEVTRILEFAGLDKLVALGSAVGFANSGMQTSFLALAEDGTGGLHKAIQDGLFPIGDPGEALARFPASTQELWGARVDPGAILRNVETLVRETFPESVEFLDEGERALDEFVGFPVRPELESLGPITLIGASVTPPAGGLVSDQLLLVRSEELGPYWSLIERLAKRFGADAESLEGPRSERILYLSGSSHFARAGGLFRFREEGVDLAEKAQDFLPQVIAGQLALARHDLPGGLSLVSNAPQPILRYLSHHAKGPKLEADESFAGEVKRRFERASVASVHRAGPVALAVYNTLVGLGNTFPGYGALLGVECGLLPPAEEFLDAQGIGYIELRTSDRGVSVRTDRAIESGSALAAAAGGLVVAGLVTPVMLRGRVEAQKIQSTNNLKQLFAALITYANEKGAFPSAPSRRSADTFALLLASEAGAGLPPTYFVRADGSEVPAPVDETGAFRLSEEHLSYEIVPWPVKPFDSLRVLLYERDPREDGTVLVLLADGSILEMDSFELESRLDEERPEEF